MMATNNKKWKASKDPLYRGDGKQSVCVPNPCADDSIVRHVMYFEEGEKGTLPFFKHRGGISHHPTLRRYIKLHLHVKIAHRQAFKLL
jgi:hypothetical protein